MYSINKDSKQFLQQFVDDYIKKLILLRHVFGIKYLIIIKYIEPPKKLTIEKFYKCREFIDSYSSCLDLSIRNNGIRNYLSDIMDIFEPYFGGKFEYNKIADVLKKIHEPHIIKGLIKLNKKYPIVFPRTKIPATVSFYNLYVSMEFSHTDEYYHRLTYHDYNWSLYQIINNTCKILFNTVFIEKIIIYLRHIIRKP